MRPKINLISIVTADLAGMTAFYRDVIGFTVKSFDEGNYTEFESERVRFAITTRALMQEVTQDASYGLAPAGQHFELAFPCASHEAVDEAYAEITAKGARPVQPPAAMPWGQYSAFFADPDGNVHELFAD